VGTGAFFYKVDIRNLHNLEMVFSVHAFEQASGIKLIVNFS